VIKFECCQDVSYGGVLFSLPALISNGLFYKSREHFQLPDGYYGLNSIFIILAFLVLLRVKSLEKVRYLPPGELGKIVGLDRIPEVKTLRKKVGILSNSGNVEEWHNDLSLYWMEASPELSGYLYVDGHVRVYHGKLTKLPRRYVSRERLCLRGMTDYWVKDALGQPFFVVTTALTSGLLSMLRSEIIPRLLEDVPNQPSQKALKEDLYLHRFVLLFDREGYEEWRPVPDFITIFPKALSVKVCKKNCYPVSNSSFFSKSLFFRPFKERMVLIRAQYMIFTFFSSFSMINS
jgi:hypothetical protein